MDTANQSTDANAPEQARMEADAPAENVAKGESSRKSSTAQSPALSPTHSAAHSGDAAKAVPSIRLPTAAFLSQETTTRLPSPSAMMMEMERGGTPTSAAMQQQERPRTVSAPTGIQSKLPIARSPAPPNSSGLPPIQPHQQHHANIASYGRPPMGNRMISPNVIPPGGGPPANKDGPGLPMGGPGGVSGSSAAASYGYPQHPYYQQQQQQPHPGQYYQGAPMQPGAQQAYAARPPAPSVGAPGAEGQKVALTDAFSYLDRVKAEYSNQPEVYNKFLQVMREFKSNVIDANGVIGRVVHLFRGHRDLILGFNAFLPKTHHIDPSVAESGYYPGMPTSGLSSPPPPQPLYPIAPQRSQSGGPFPSPQPQQALPGGSALPSVHHPGLSQTSQMHHWTFDVNNRPPSLDPRGPPAAMPTANPIPNIVASPAMEEDSAAGPTSRANNAQFSRAISYVKKVKHRFANDSESYKTFLAALHSFHKDQKTVNEVYSQVTRLFKDDPDLLEEFMQFLPDGEALRRSSTLPPMGQFSPPSNAASGGTSAPARKSGQGKRGRHHAEAPALPSVQKTQEELDFFDRVKNFIGNKSAYGEFLKCLNLYSQDILRQDELVKLVSNFLGSNGELFSWFKKYIGYTGKLDVPASGAEDGSSEEQPTMSRRRRRDLESRERDASPGPHDIPELNLGECKRIYSYRLLPTSYRLPPAMGRDDIGKEVLNDQLLCCASFESEDSTFVSSRKNQYEEALFRCEDERFELDLLIEGNRATMAVLEPILRRLETMSKEERDAFRLDSKLNGHSAMIYRRNLVRIYGDKAESIMEALRKSPAVAIPVVLKRLRQKDEEWRQTLREWNSVWRTVHLKNYYKALDHQGIDFKQNDRKNLSVKLCLTEAEAKGAEAWRVELEPAALDDALALIEQSIKSAAVMNSSDRKAALDIFYLVRDEFMARRDAEPLVMYANSSLMAVVRLVHMAAERLQNIKRVALKANTEPHHARKVSVVASFLDLVPVEENGAAHVPGGDLYESLLELTRSLLGGSLDISVYEERVRFMFGAEAFPMYTFDRLVHVAVRCLQQNIINDPTCENLLRLFSTWKAGRTNDSSSGLRLSEWTARMACENIVSQSRDTHLYRIERGADGLSFQMVPSLGNTQDSLPRAEDAWSAYIDEFVNRIDANPKYLSGGSAVFLPRSLRRTVSRNPQGISDRLLIRYRLECKICVNTFRLLFVAGTEDLLCKHRPSSVEIRVSGANN